MKEKFERIDPLLYRRQYQTAGGKSRVLYYGIFVDWKGQRRRFPLGEYLKRARNKLGELSRKNDAEFDFDEKKAEREARGTTLFKWIELCVAKNVTGLDPSRTMHLKSHLGADPLASIDDETVRKYREQREGEKIIRHGKPSKKSVSSTTINKEVSCLRKLLRLARKKGYKDKVTEFPMAAEKARNRVLTDDEYKRLLEHCPSWLRCACVGAWETCLTRGDLLRLTWNEIDLHGGMIELKEGRGKTGADQAIPIVTDELKALLAELQEEKRKTPNVEGLVFTIDGQPIDELKFEYYFRKALRAAKIKNFTFHDFRHCAVTRWAKLGLPTAAAMLAAGHKSVRSHKVYENLQRDQLSEMFTRCYQGSKENRVSSAG